ncbi:10560_t:CDS:2 [Ambispora gerdemannii]|uniref:10560_t:CDS:1 n=1 Tax=Ambispora gerdemannii TaxID=144530 RepID=A0A9N8VTZ7_9GLOM|nr:10560_t:CDS:2 [Ambispora gerdemannii]
MPSQQHMLSDDAQEVIDEVIACARYGEYEELLECMRSQSTNCLVTKSSFGNTALHMACANGHLAGRSAIYEAQQNNHEKIVEYLLNVVDPIKPETVDENIEAEEKHIINDNNDDTIQAG